MDKNAKKDILKNILWSLITIIISVLTINAITSQAKGFSVNDALVLIKNGKKGFMVLAMLSVIIYIYLEGAAIRHILIHISSKISHKQAFLYSAADIYFSAITPSASGGQPASFYFMRKDGISFSKATMSLVLNLLMYSFAIDFVAVLSFIIRPDIFTSFNTWIYNNECTYSFLFYAFKRIKMDGKAWILEHQPFRETSYNKKT